MIKPSNSAEGVMVRLVNKIKAALEINATTLKVRVDYFVSMKYGRTSSKAHFDKVNTYNELTSDKMTVKVFFKFLRIIGIKKIVMKLTLTTVRDREVTVEETVNMIIHEPKGETSVKEKQ